MAEKQTALITGACGGFGRCLAEIHARQGGNLILSGRSQERLDALKKELEEKHQVTVHTIVADLTQPDAPQHIYDACKHNGWQVDYLINNAGFGGRGDFTRGRSMEQDLAMIAVNVEAPTRLCKLFLPDFVARGAGRVLNVSSTAAVMPGLLQACYYATKAYVTSWSNALWRELRGTGVIVTCLMPGAMETGFAKAGSLTGTKLFAHPVEPMPVAQAGYDGMLRGKMNVTAGLPGWQRPMIALAPLFPKKLMMDFVYSQQLDRSAE